MTMRAVLIVGIDLQILQMDVPLHHPTRRGYDLPRMFRTKRLGDPGYHCHRATRRHVDIAHSVAIHAQPSINDFQLLS